MKTKTIVVFLFAAAILMARDNILQVNYGPEQSIREGDDDFYQIFFFRVEEKFTDSLYVRIFDMDCGGDVDLNFGSWNTTLRYELYGGKGAFSAQSLKNAKPDKADITAGVSLAMKIIGEVKELNNSWHNFAHIHPADGEKIGDSYYFKLVVQGVSGNDANVFDVRLSTSASMNTAAAEFSMFSHSPTLRLGKDENFAAITFFVPAAAKSISVNNFDLAGASVQLVTPFRSNLPVVSSGQGEWVKSRTELEPIETGRQCAVVLGQGSESPNDVSLFIMDDLDRVLLVSLPVYLRKPNQRPVILTSLIALSDCQSIVFDAKASNDPDGDLLDFNWDFGDGSTATGSRIVHRYDEQKTYEARLIVSDNSGDVGNSTLKSFRVKVNKPPVAQAGKEIITAPNTMVSFDGSRSSDQDGRITQYSWDFGDGRTASGALTTHSYLNPGTYRTMLRVEDDSDSPCNFASHEIKVWVNAPPQAQAGEDVRAAVSQILTFSGDKSSDSDGEIVSYNWDFGDSKKSLGKIVQHSFSTLGKYTVRLSVTDNANVSNSSQMDELVVIINDPPTARAGRDCKGAIGEVLNFDGSSSSDNDGAITDYIWDFGDGTRSEGKKTSHAYKKSGKFTAVLLVQDDSGTDSHKSSDSLQVFINEPPVAEAGQDQLVTASEVFFSAASSIDQDGEIVKYDWNFGDGSTGTGVTPKHVYGETGRYQIKLTVTDNSGTKSNQSSDLVNVIINEKPIADAGPDKKASIGQQIVFDAAGSRDPDGEISEYIWDFGDGQTASGKSASHHYNQSGIFSARLTVKDNTGQLQAADYDEAIVTVNSQPVARGGANILTSPEATVLFDGSGSFDLDNDALSFQWQFSDGKNQAEVAQLRRSFPKPGIYSGTFTVSDHSNTSNSVSRDTVEIRINSAPIANAGENIYCCDKTLIFDGSASVDPDGDPLTYTWDFGDGSIPGHGVEVMHKYERGGTYPVILTVDDGLGLINSRHSTSITAAINNPPIADAGKNETYCSGEVIIFNAGNSKDPENGLLKYLWDFGDGTTAEGLNPTKIYKKDGIYQIKLTVQDDSGLPCNTDVVIKTIRIIESPVALAGSDQQVCTNAQVIFDGTSSRDFDGVVNNYFWDFGDGTTGGGATPTHTYKKAGVYRVVLTITGDLRGECDNSDTDEILVTVMDAPFAQISCPEMAPINTTVVFDGSSSTGEGMEISEYLWDFGDGGAGQGKTASHSYEKSGIYIIKLTITTNATTVCNSSVAQKLITVNDRPIAEAGPDQLVGINQVFILNGAASKDPDGAVVSFLWNFGAGKSQSGVIARHRMSEVGCHPIVLSVIDNTTAENNSDSDTVWVTVNDPPLPIITANSAACPGEMVNFSALESQKMDGKNITCLWNFGDGQTEQGLFVSHQFVKSGQYNVTLAMDDGLMLDNSKISTSMIIIINRPPVADAGGDRLTCPGQELVFDATKSYDPDGSVWNAEWDFGDGTKSTDKVVMHVYQKPGHYSVKLLITDDSGGACSSNDNVISVIVNSPPVAAAGADRQVYYGGAHDAVLFDATASIDPDGDGLVYEWDFGDGTHSDGAKLYHAYEKPGVYWAKLFVDDGRKTPCSKSQDEVKIEVMNRN